MSVSFAFRSSSQPALDAAAHIIAHPLHLGQLLLPLAQSLLHVLCPPPFVLELIDQICVSVEVMLAPDPLYAGLDDDWTLALAFLLNTCLCQLLEPFGYKRRVREAHDSAPHALLVSATACKSPMSWIGAESSRRAHTLLVVLLDRAQL